MNNIPIEMWDIWESGRFVGENRPITRAVVSRDVLQTNGPWRTILFPLTGGVQPFIEIPNIVTCTIDRRLGTDAASMSLVIKNTLPPSAQDNLDEAHDGAGFPTRRELRDLGKPGYFTFRRGVAVDTDGVNPWAHEATEWVDLLIPNRVVKTFQGYGTNGAANPAIDDRLTLTGIWLIDRVEYTAGGLITVSCRDLAKLLIEQRLYPPIVPVEKYPLEFCADHQTSEIVTRTNVTTKVIPGQQGPNVASKITSGWDSSVAPWYGQNGSVYGHRASHAFDGNETSYWLSVGNGGPNQPWSFEWIGADTKGELVNRIRFKQKWGGYRVYVGVKEDGKWQGTSVVPYGATSGPAHPNDSNRPYIMSLTTPRNNNWITIELPRMYRADQVRLTFTNLANSGIGTYPYRAAVYEFRVDSYVPERKETTTTTTEEEVIHDHPGNIGDYTDIVKILCALAGFHWPHTNPDPVLTRWFFHGENVGQLFGTLGTPTVPGQPVPENLRNFGRVWGDFFYSGAYPVEPPCIPASYWDNKSVMDGINQIKEILGFIFMVDTHGGIQWRPPNIWRTGNYVKGIGYMGETSVHTVSETNVLLDYGTIIDDANLRSDIIVVSADDPSVHGSFQPGWAEGESSPGTELSDLSLLAGQQRVMLVSNYPFGTAEDPFARAQIEKFAFLVSLWIHWSYRRSRFRIPGNPAFEIDDQVRIYERTTSETYVHYIEGYTSTMDLEAGTWIMDMDTHWLGNGPSQQWVIRSNDMHPALFAYLRSIGQIPAEIEDDESKYPDDWFIYQPPDVPDTPVRVEDDYSHLFPLPPGVEWPSGDISTEIDGIPDGYVAPPNPSTGFTGTVINCSNTMMFNHWGSNCASAPKTRLLFQATSGPKHVPGQTSNIYLTVHSKSVKAWEALIIIMRQQGFVMKNGQCGSYNCRRIKLTGGGYSKNWSNHSWATAVDINYRDLPQGRPAPAGHGIIGVAQKALALRTGNGKPIFRWGGTWSGSKVDPMHFEVCCTAADLATGVRLSAGGGDNFFL